MKFTNFHKFRARVFLSLIFTIVIFPYSIHAAPADLDPTFGIGGKVTTDFRSYSDGTGGLALQSDGKLVAAGSSWNGPTGGSSRTDFALARYNGDGSLDTTFGTGGKVITDFNGDNDIATSVVIQPDGKILAGGSAGFVGMSHPNGAFAFARYNPDGSLDPSFGVGGKVTTIFSGVNDVITGLALQADGKIVAAGYRYVKPLAVGVDNDIALARYNPDGTLDPTFGTGGMETISYGPYNNDMANAVVIQGDGNIIVAGQTGNNNSFQTFIPTITFGSPPYDRATNIAIQPDGKILIVGYASTNLGGTNKVAIARLNADFTPDASFGVGGKVTTECGAQSQVGPSGLAIQTNGKFVVGGRTCLARYNSDGTLDGTFGAGGILMDSISPSVRASAIRIQTDGKIVAAGAVTIGAYTDFGLARYMGDPVVPTNHPPSADGVSPMNSMTEPMMAQMFTAAYSDPDGWQNIAAANLYFSGNGGMHNEWLHYLVAPNLFTMMGSNDSCSPGQAKTLSNGFLTLDCSTSSISGSGTMLTVIFQVTPEAPSSGIQYNIFTAASDQAGGAYAIFAWTWQIQ